MSLIISTTGGISSIEVETGNVIKTYKTSEPIAHGTAVLDGGSAPSTLMVAQKNKPLIHTYQLRKEAVLKRIVLPNKMGAIALSPCGRWLAAGSQDGTLYVWNLRSTALLTLQTEAHFQAITTLAWSSDSHVLVSGGADARILVWRSSDLIATPGKPPKYVLTSHSLPIASLKIGAGSFREARLFTASLDSTCCVYDLFSGILLYTLVADSKITAMAVDPAERAIYLGCDDGIHFVPLYYELQSTKKLAAAGSAEGSVISTNTIERIFKTTTTNEDVSAFTAFAVSPDGVHLISGSENGTVALWEVGSGQLLRNYRATKGSVCQILYEPKEFTSHVVEISLLQRNVEGAQAFTDFVPNTGAPQALSDSGDFDAEIDTIFSGEAAKGRANATVTNDSAKESDASSAGELNELKHRYSQLKKMYDELWAKYAAS